MVQDVLELEERGAELRHVHCTLHAVMLRTMGTRGKQWVMGEETVKVAAHIQSSNTTTYPQATVWGLVLGHPRVVLRRQRLLHGRCQVTQRAPRQRQACSPRSFLVVAMGLLVRLVSLGVACVILLVFLALGLLLEQLPHLGSGRPRRAAALGRLPECQLHRVHGGSHHVLRCLRHGGAGALGDGLGDVGLHGDQLLLQLALLEAALVQASNQLLVRLHGVQHLPRHHVAPLRVALVDHVDGLEVVRHERSADLGLLLLCQLALVPALTALHLLLALVVAVAVAVAIAHVLVVIAVGALGLGLGIRLALGAGGTGTSAGTSASSRVGTVAVGNGRAGGRGALGSVALGGQGKLLLDADAGALHLLRSHAPDHLLARGRHLAVLDVHAGQVVVEEVVHAAGTVLAQPAGTQRHLALEFGVVLVEER